MVQTRLCPTCGNPFDIPSMSHQRYCSEPCRPKYQGPKRKRPPVEVKCGHCGKTFERRAWVAEKQQQLGRAQYCSVECRDAAKRGRKGTRKVKWKTLECPTCGKSFESAPWEVRQGRKFCSHSCAAKTGGRPTKGRKWIDAQGYVRVYVPPEQRPVGRKQQHYPEHRVVMAEMLGRWPESHETVHHINGDKTDNRPENLQLRNGRHGKGGVLRCRSCGSHDIEHVELS